MDEDEDLELCERCRFPIIYIPWLDCDLCPECDETANDEDIDD